ncbi:MAG: TetR/AcrR family transcriptional regulator [Myxococcales bacterium]
MSQRRAAPQRRAVGRPTKDKSRETETQILDAAEQVFARVGFYGATTQEIAEASGVTKAMIHYYFDSKEKLYRAVLDRILFELIKLVQETHITAITRTERMDHFVRGFFDYVARHPQFGRLTFMGSGDQSRYFDGIVSTFFRPLFEKGTRFIDEGIAEGEFRQVDAQRLLLAVYSACMGYFADAHFISLVTEDDALKAARVEACRETVLDMVYRTLGVEAPRPKPRA